MVCWLLKLLLYCCCDAYLLLLNPSDTSLGNILSTTVSGDSTAQPSPVDAESGEFDSDFTNLKPQPETPSIFEYIARDLDRVMSYYDFFRDGGDLRGPVSVSYVVVSEIVSEIQQ